MRSRSPSREAGRADLPWDAHPTVCLRNERLSRCALRASRCSDLPSDAHPTVWLRSERLCRCALRVSRCSDLPWDARPTVCLRNERLSRRTLRVSRCSGFTCDRASRSKTRKERPSCSLAGVAASTRRQLQRVRRLARFRGRLRRGRRLRAWLRARCRRLVELPPMTDPRAYSLNLVKPARHGASRRRSVGSRTSNSTG